MKPAHKRLKQCVALHCASEISDISIECDIPRGKAACVLTATFHAMLVKFHRMVIVLCRGMHIAQLIIRAKSRSRTKGCQNAMIALERSLVLTLESLHGFRKNTRRLEASNTLKKCT
eukprot:scaffold2868_cov348-Pavlova_lutheri.AAC.15